MSSAAERLGNAVMNAKLPPLPPDCHGRPKGNRYKEQFGVIVVCRDELHQKAVYEFLKDRFDKIKVVRT